MTSSRVELIDNLRGLAIGAMILVNNPGSWAYVYGPLKHASWHGLTPTDVIFPGFIFVMGLAMSLPLASGATTRVGWSSYALQLARRGLILLLLGWFLALFYYDFGQPDYSWWHDRLLTIRLPGVLQRLALVYVCSALIIKAWRARGQFLWTIGLLVFYTLIMLYLPYTDASGNQYQGLWRFGNSMAAYIDNAVLGAEHVYYAGATPFAFDPEGIFSTLPAIATCLSGVLCGRFIQQPSLLPAVATCIVLLIVGLAISPVIPINKALWTPSFVLVTSAIMLGLLVTMRYVERFGWWHKVAVVLQVCGTNSIVFFMLAGVLARIIAMIPVGHTSLKSTLFQWLVSMGLSNHLASLCFALLFLLVCYLPVLLLFKKRCFIRV